jgi:hypothetical protein
MFGILRFMPFQNPYLFLGQLAGFDMNTYSSISYQRHFKIWTDLHIWVDLQQIWTKERFRADLTYSRSFKIEKQQLPGTPQVCFVPLSFGLVIGLHRVEKV